MRQKIKGIIFDLDGTLANTLPLCILAFRQSVEPLALRPVSDEEIIATFGPSEEGTIMTLIPDHYEEGIANYLQFYERLHERCPEPFPGIRELLVRLQVHSIRIAMVTGKGRHSTDISLRQFGLDTFFEIIETGSPAGPRKAEGIEKVLSEWPELEKGEVLYLGDAPSDITASHKVGIHVAAAAWAETAEPEVLKALGPDAIFYSLDEFEEWLFPILPAE
jgi:phosphoglycolate phosphatase/pyrophosphatase PpaX